MAKRVNDARLESRNARAALEARSKPYYKALDREVHLGYRKGKKGGAWLVRYYVGGQRYKEKVFARADDFSDADGEAILDFWSAQKRAHEILGQVKAGASDRNIPVQLYTVADALEDYLKFLQAHRKDEMNARNRIKNHILPQLGECKIFELTQRQIEHWHRELARTPARVRCTSKGVAQYRPSSDDDEETLRKRKVTANKCLTILKAALNRAKKVHEGEIPDDAWRMVGSFRNVNAPRVRFLEIGEAKRLINAAPPDLRNLIQGGLLTGARYGELTRLKCHEFDANSGTIHIRTAKAGIRRDVVLNDEGKKLFESLTAGRSGDSFVFVRSDGEPWGTGHQTRPFNAAVQRAEIKPGITFHGLRHTYASLAIMGGMPLLVVAKNLGHRDTRMVEQHYGHLADDFFAQKVRETAPSYGLGESNVVELDR